jgi:hypothetical protein
MANESINPYESPEAFNSCVSHRTKSVITVRLRNIAFLAVAGYVVVIATELGIRWAAITEEPWKARFWASGLIGSVLFATSEAFNLRPLEQGSFVLRIAATIGVLVATLFLAEIVCETLGWNQRTYFDDPSSTHRFVLFITTFFVTTMGAHCALIFIEHEIKKPRRDDSPRA